MDQLGIATHWMLRTDRELAQHVPVRRSTLSSRSTWLRRCLPSAARPQGLPERSKRLRADDAVGGET